MANQTIKVNPITLFFNEHSVRVFKNRDGFIVFVAKDIKIIFGDKACKELPSYYRPYYTDSKGQGLEYYYWRDLVELYALQVLHSRRPSPKAYYFINSLHDEFLHTIMVQNMTKLDEVKTQKCMDTIWQLKETGR